MIILIETFLSVILITFSCLLFSSIIGGCMSINNARNYYAAVVERVENSDYSEEVIQMVRTEASEKGYELEIEPYSTKDGEPCYFVSLSYEVDYPVFHLFGTSVTKQGKLEGYAGT